MQTRSNSSPSTRACVVTIVLLSLLLGSTTSAGAEDVPVITFLPMFPNPATLEASPVFGVMFPGNTSQGDACAGRMLAVGLQIGTDGSLVTGLRLICESMGAIAGTGNTTEFPPPQFDGVMRTVRCESGRAMSGIELRAGLSLDAITIICADVVPTFSTVIQFTNDPVFGAGKAALVRALGAFTMGQPIGGPGGERRRFICGNERFLHTVQWAADDRHVNAVQFRCHRAATRPIDPSDAEADLIPRTIGQAPFRSPFAADGLTVQLFNLGAAIPTDEADSLYVDLIFSSTSVQFTTVPAFCFNVSTNRIRCPITNAASFARGGFVAFNVTYRNIAGPFGSPPFVVQASYNITDLNYGNNTYGFEVFPQ